MSRMSFNESPLEDQKAPEAENSVLDSEAEHQIELEEQIFEQIDDEIREFHDKCKDLVYDLSQSIKDISVRHREIAHRFMKEII